MHNPFSLPHPKRVLACWEWVARWVETLTPLFVLIGVLVLAALVYRVQGQQGALHRQQQEIQQSRRDATLRVCREANTRHAEAIPQLIALIRNGEATAPRAQREAQEEAISTLLGGRSTGGVNGPREPGPPPRTAAGRLALEQIQAFIQIIAPRYDCERRTRELTKP